MTAKPIPDGFIDIEPIKQAFSEIIANMVVEKAVLREQLKRSQERIKELEAELDKA